ASGCQTWLITFNPGFIFKRRIIMQTLPQRYLEQLKKGLLHTLNRDVPAEVIDPPSMEVMLQPGWFDHFWSGDALTMCSPKHLANTQFCIEDCLARGVPGDLIE